MCAYRDLKGCGGSVRRVAPEGSAAVGPGAGPATPVREERDQDHCAQVGCVLSWLVRDVQPLLAGGRKLSWRERRASR